MNNKEFSVHLENRTKAFALSIFRLSESLPNGIEFSVIKKQLCKSGSSIGANYREANRARSLADFKSKIGICEAEASETCYWLELANSLQHTHDFEGILKEANELLSIFISISKSLKRK